MVCFPRRDSLALSHHGKCLVLMLLRFHSEPSPVQAEHFRDEYNAPAGVENPDTQRTVKGPCSGKWIHCTLWEFVFLDHWITDIIGYQWWVLVFMCWPPVSSSDDGSTWWEVRNFFQTSSDSRAGLLARSHRWFELSRALSWFVTEDGKAFASLC